MQKAIRRRSPSSVFWRIVENASARGTIVLVLAIVLAVAFGMAFSLLGYEVQVYLVLLVATILGAIWFIPRAVRKEPSVTVTMLSTALALKLIGSLGRYLMIGNLYEKGDAIGYDRAGVATYEAVRALDFSHVQDPFFGTAFMQDFTGLVYAFIGPSMLGAFLVFALLSFVGMWCFYRAHRIAFPGGDARLFFLFMFFLPTMFFWPSSLGKDALVIFGLGVGSLAIARLLNGFSGAAALQLVLGLVATFLIRPPVAVMLLAAGGFAYMIHPGRMSQPLARPTSWILVAPLLAAGLFFSGRWAASFEDLESVEGTVQTYSETRNRLESGGSQFRTVLPSSPLSAVTSVATVLFRPFPWEVDLGPAALTGLEGLAVLLIFVTRFTPAIRGLREWRRGMVVFAALMTMFLIVPLTAFSNFGLLARQRAQLLPFVFMILTVVSRRSIRVPVSPPAPSQASAPVPAGTI